MVVTAGETRIHDQEGTMSEMHVITAACTVSSCFVRYSMIVKPEGFLVSIIIIVLFFLHVTTYVWFISKGF